VPDGIRASGEARIVNDLEKSLHSRYNPRAEAARYIDSLQLKNTIECFILIEPGFGFLIPVLRERFPDSKIIILHTGKCLSRENLTSDCAVYCGVSDETDLISQTHDIKIFLETEIPNIDIAKIKIIEWRPSMNYFKEAYVKLLSQSVEFLKRIDAGKRTTAHFGKRWFKNYLKNICYIKKIISFKKSDIPVIVTGSGPSLENALPFIKDMQEYCLIIAASSSITALSFAEIKPDIIITTDGGNWARKHLHILFSDTANLFSNTAFAANLCAALPSQCSERPFLLINDGSFWQSVILHELSLPSIIIGQRGTVSATAAELAMQLSNGNIYLAGMDFSNSDIRTHAKPYAFDNIFFAQANRFFPVYSAAFKRSSLLKDGGSMKIYETWFKDQLSSWQKNIYSLTEHKIFKQSRPEKHSNKKILKDFLGVSDVNNSLSGKNAQNSNCLKALFSALENQQFADNIKNELTSLLFPPDSRNVTKEDLKSKILEVIEN